MLKKLESWIIENLDVKQGQYADLTQNMERQCPYDIVGSYRDWDPKELWDWIERIQFSYLLDHFPKEAKVLDIGFGDGWPSLLIAPEVGHVIGIDVADQRVKKAKENKTKRGIENVEFLKMSSENMNFANNTFDGAISYSCIEQTDSYATIQEIYRVLKPGGTLIGSMQNFLIEKSGEILWRVGPTAFTKSTYDDYFIIYQIQDIETLTEKNYILTVSEKFDQLIREQISDESFLTMNDDQIIRFEQLLLKHQSEIIQCNTYTTQHLSIQKVKEYLERAGFKEISFFSFKNLKKIYQLLQSWKETDTLNQLGEHFFELTDGFKQLLEVEEGNNTNAGQLQVIAIK